MLDSHFLISVLRAEIDRLEKLRRLENRMYTVAPADRPAVQEKIHAVTEEVESLNRTIQEHRATHTKTTSNAPVIAVILQDAPR